MKSTIQNLLDKGPCSEGLKFLKSSRSLPKLWRTCERADWMIWALQQLELFDERTARIFAVACAEHTLHFFEDKYPEDNRPRQAIEFARTLIDNPQAAWSAARSAAERAENKWQADKLRELINPFAVKKEAIAA